MFSTNRDLPNIANVLLPTFIALALGVCSQLLGRGCPPQNNRNHSNHSINNDGTSNDNANYNNKQNDIAIVTIVIIVTMALGFRFRASATKPCKQETARHATGMSCCQCIKMPEAPRHDASTAEAGDGAAETACMRVDPRAVF